MPGHQSGGYFCVVNQLLNRVWWHPHHKKTTRMKCILKWVGIIFGSLAGILLLTTLAAFVLSSRRINKIYTVPPAPKLNWSLDPGHLARRSAQRHLAHSHAERSICPPQQRRPFRPDFLPETSSAGESGDADHQARPCGSRRYWN
jgi:hypothetical protein